MPDYNENSYSASTNANKDRKNPIKKGLIERLYSAYKELKGRDLNLKPEDGGPVTSWSGTRKASPSLDRFNREWYEPAERRALIAQLEELLADHPILRAALVKYSHGAVAAGFTVHVTSAARGTLQRALAQRIIDRIKKRTKLETILPSIAFSLPTYGDVFLQPVIDKNSEIISVIQMPVASMERKTDDRDQWIDSEKAFLQRDVATIKIEDYFTAGQIIHARHLHVPGHRYGTSQIFSVRGVAKDAIDAIRSILPRRLANQPFRWYKLTQGDNQPLSPPNFQEFQKNTSRRIAMESGKGLSPYDDIYTNNVDLKILGGDPNLGTMTDIEMLIDASLSTIGVSRQLIGWGTNINRDVLDEQRDELYAAQQQFAKEITEQLLIPLFELGLELQGINPDEITIQIEYHQQFTDRQIEKRLDNARKDFIAGGISRRTYVKTLSMYYSIENVDDEVNEILRERGITPTTKNAIKSENQAQSRAIQPPTAAPKTQNGIVRALSSPPQGLIQPKDKQRTFNPSEKYSSTNINKVVSSNGTINSQTTRTSESSTENIINNK